LEEIERRWVEITGACLSSGKRLHFGQIAFDFRLALLFGYSVIYAWPKALPQLVSRFLFLISYDEF